MSYPDIKDAMVKHIEITDFKKLYENLKAYRLNWIQRTPEHIDFLGSNYVGVYAIRFTVPDEDLFYALYNIDKITLQQDIYQVKGIEKNMKTISNPFYNTITYTMHKLYTSINTKLKPHELHDAIKELFFIMVYKMTGSINSRRFSYACSPELAKATHERMSHKFLLKKFNSWQDVFEYKALDVLPKGIHYPRLVKYNTDSANRVISDVQTKLRDIYRNVMQIMMAIKDEKEVHVKSTSVVQAGEDEENYSGISVREDMYINWLNTRMRHYNDVYYSELITFILLEFNVVERQSFENILRKLCELYDKDEKLRKLVEEMMTGALRYLTRKGISSNYTKNLHDVMTTIKGYFATKKTGDDGNIIYTKMQKYVNDVLASNSVKSYKLKPIIHNATVGILTYLTLLALMKAS